MVSCGYGVGKRTEIAREEEGWAWVGAENPRGVWAEYSMVPGQDCALGMWMAYGLGVGLLGPK